MGGMVSGGQCLFTFIWYPELVYSFMDLPDAETVEPSLSMWSTVAYLSKTSVQSSISITIIQVNVEISTSLVCKHNLGHHVMVI